MKYKYPSLVRLITNLRRLRGEEERRTRYAWEGGGRIERERGSERGLLIRSAVVDPSRVVCIAIQLVKYSGCSKRRTT